MKKILIAIAVLALAVTAVMKLQATRDGLLGQQEAIVAAWTRVDSALTKRSRTIPDLMGIVDGLAPGGTAIRGDIGEARKALEEAASAEARIRANSQLDGALGRLLVKLESSVPDSAQSRLVRFYDELAAAENNIAVERRKYNESVQKYNTSIELFPGNLAAAIFGFTRSDAYFGTEPTGRRAPAANK